MRKTILLIILAMIIGAFLFAAYYTVMYFIKFKSEVKYDNYLNFTDNKILVKFLNGLKYKVHKYIFTFDRNVNKANIIIIEQNSSLDLQYDEEYYLKKLEYYKSQNLKGKRIIALFNYSFDFKDHGYFSDNDFTSYEIDSDDNFLKDVDKLYLNYKSDLRGDLEKLNIDDFVPLLTINDRLIMAVQKHNGGEIIYISDIYIFSDKSLLKDGNAVLLNNLLKDYHKQTVFIDSIFEVKKEEVKKPVYFVFLSYFPFLLMQSIIIFTAFVMVFVKRFGAPVESDKYKKRSIIYHLDAVGKYFEKSSSNFGLAKIFDQYFTERLQKVVRFRSSDQKSFFSDIIKRYDVRIQDQIIFSLNNTDKFSEIQAKRERFLKKIMRGDK